MTTEFLLTRLLRGATGVQKRVWGFEIISTHAPLTRRDGVSNGTNGLYIHFYSRASYEARLRRFPDILNPQKFLLTRLLRGATNRILNFRRICSISTHAPLTRRDETLTGSFSADNGFLLTRLLRGATKRQKSSF